MAWRGLHISRPAKLSLRQHHVHILSDEEDAEPVYLPLEDIAWIILDSPQITLSSALLGMLAENGVALIVPDARHHPVGMLLSFHQHHAQAAIAHTQISISAPLCKRLWQKLVQSKINNQAYVLQKMGDDYATTLHAMAQRVNSGDPENIEAQAARAYWGHYMHGFRRHADDRINALLNYGYAIVRAALARSCAAFGLIPAFGLHHKSQANAFNLVDDLIEPFRPFVDLLARARIQDADADSLTLEDRRFMASILLQTAYLDKEQLTILTASELMAASLVRAMEQQSAALLRVPQFELAR